MKLFLTLVSYAAAVASCPYPVAGQWLNYPTPGIPRTADGKPNLSAPAPRTADGKPDLSGIWEISAGTYLYNVAADLKPGDVQPWADALYKQRMENWNKDDPAKFLCLPAGPRYGVQTAKIIQTPALVVVLYEDMVYRQIFLDGRPLPKDPNPSFMGYSVGRWDGDTLVVESAGFNDRTWIDNGGHPHTESLRLTERFRRRDFGHVDLQATFEDPSVYAKPLSIPLSMTFAPDTELIETVCNENEKDRVHMVGKRSEEEARYVSVPPEVLAKYAGTYEFSSRWVQDPGPVTVTLSDGQLQIPVSNRTAKLRPLSQTTFSAFGGELEFLMDSQGAVTGLVIRANPETSGQATRK